ncbi:hypothetical protein AAC387_Pa09g2146 [Persea americana]
MRLQRIRLNEALKKLHRKSSSRNMFERYKFESPASPTSTLNFGGEEAMSQSSAIPRDIPEGYFAVYVGDESKRYVIPLNYLDHQTFQALLSRAEEEFGYSSSGAIRIPCDTVFFDHLLWLLNRHDPSVQSLEMEELLKFYQ